MQRDNDYVNAVGNAVEVIEAISANKEPMTPKDVIAHTGIKKNTVHRILHTLTQHKWLRRVGEAYEPDMALASLWARYKARLEAERDSIDREIRELEV